MIFLYLVFMVSSNDPPNSMTFGYWQCSETRNWLSHTERQLAERTDGVWGRGRTLGQQNNMSMSKARAAEWARKPEQRIWTGSSRRWVENGSHDRLFSGPCRGLPLKDHENDHMSIRVLRALMWHWQVGWTRIRKEEEQRSREQATAEVQGWDDQGLEQDDGQEKSAARLAGAWGGRNRGSLSCAAPHRANTKAPHALVIWQLGRKPVWSGHWSSVQVSPRRE